MISLARATMMTFDLPYFEAPAKVEDALSCMIRNNVSGVVLRVGGEFRLLHYMQVQDAWIERLGLGDIKGFVPLAPFDSSTEPPQIFWLERGVPSPPMHSYAGRFEPGVDFVGVSSIQEGRSESYRASSPGFCCTGPKGHTYPPLTPGPGNNCVVLGCSGSIP